MDEKTKSRNLMILGSSVLLIGLLSVIPAKWFSYGKNSSGESSLLSVSNKLTSESANGDTDGDGLKNWEEALYGTDPTKADTDSNGISDKEELYTKEGSEQSQKYGITSQSELNNPDNLTAQLAKNTYTISAYLDQQNITDGEVVKKIGENLVEESLPKGEYKVYTALDLKILKENNRDNLIEYASAIIKKITSTSDFSKVDNLNIISEYLSSKDEKVLEKYNNEIIALTSFRDSLLEIKIPKEAAVNHINLLNNTELYLNTLTDFSKTDKDPVRAMLALKSYDERRYLFLSSREESLNFIKSNVLPLFK